MNGLSIAKKSNVDFVNILSKNDIIFLYETWTSAEFDINFSGYISHTFYRTFQNRNAKRCSGGVALYYKESLQDGIQIVKNQLNTMIWVKFDRNFFNLDDDVYISGTYIWCEDSPAYNIVDVDLFELLENDVDYFSNFGTVFIIGDMNSRVGLKMISY